MKTLTVKREGTSTEFSYEIVWDGSYERLAGCVENLKFPAKKACIVTDSTVSELYLRKDGQEKKIADVTVAVGLFAVSSSRMQTGRPVYGSFREFPLSINALPEKNFVFQKKETFQIGFFCLLRSRSRSFAPYQTTIAHQTKSCVMGTCPPVQKPL